MLKKQPKVVFAKNPITEEEKQVLIDNVFNKGDKAKDFVFDLYQNVVDEFGEIMKGVHSSDLKINSKAREDAINGFAAYSLVGKPAFEAACECAQQIYEHEVLSHGNNLTKEQMGIVQAQAKTLADIYIGMAFKTLLDNAEEIKRNLE